MTVAPSAIPVWSVPAFAVGAVLLAAVGTVMVTVSVAVLGVAKESETVSVNTSTALLVRLDGAVKLCRLGLKPVSATVGVPLVWVQE